MGNSGLNANTNFIGTTDSVDVVFRTNNRERFRIAADGATLLNGHLDSKQANSPVGSVIFGGNTGNVVLTTATDVAGKITFTAGGSGTAKAEITVTFAQPYPNAPIVMLTPGDVNGVKAFSGNDAYVVPSTTGFTIKFNSNASNNNIYTFYYHVIGTR